MITPRPQHPFRTALVATLVLFLTSLAAVSHADMPVEESTRTTIPRMVKPLKRLVPTNVALSSLRGEQIRELGVTAWHHSGYRGAHVKIAILDSGFRGWHDHLGKALPNTVTVKSFRHDTNLEARDSQHGILCGEVVHALAPDADLYFANWEPDEPSTFLAALRWARGEGVRVVTCSVIMPSWSDGEGGGPVHEELTKIVGFGSRADDILCFASAGNVAQRHWSGTYAGDLAGFHLWKENETANVVTPFNDERIAIELCCKCGSDYELSVRDRASGIEVAKSTGNSADRQSCVVARFQPETKHTYDLRVRLVHGPGGSFHCVALGAGMRYAAAKGSIAFPADGPSVLAVGAVDHDGRRMSYSSCGPNSAQPKPDLVAAVPFVSLWRSKPFAGTSAAAPQAAALAALWYSRHPDWSAGQVRQAIQKSALDLGEPGHDTQTGYGLVHLP